MKTAIQERESYTLRVYNHASSCFETVEVTEEVYRTYRRTEWNIHDNDDSFYAHEIQFSSLIGGSEDAFQNFREFIDTENIPDQVIEQETLHEKLLKAIASLPEKERVLIRTLYFEGRSETDYAKQCEVKQQTINEKKHRILRKLKKLMA